MNISEKVFGKYKGEQVKEYTLTNDNQISLSVITYGAIITQIRMPDKDDVVENVTVNFETLDEIVENRPFHGAIIGRVSGRIADAKYKDGDKEYKLDKSEGNNMLHGGFNGLDTKNWTAQPIKNDNQVSLILTTHSPHLESGFPGNLDVKVTYTLNNQNEVRIKYEAKTDERTLFNPTNHVYFNLSGENKESIHQHEIQVDSDSFAVLDEENIPTGELRDVDSTPFDLRTLTKLAEVLESDEEQIKERDGLDHPFALNQTKDKPAAILNHEESGRKLLMHTDRDAVVIFSHNTDKEPVTVNEKTIKAHSGITLETSTLPDAVNHENFGSIFLSPDETYISETVFQFLIEE